MLNWCVVTSLIMHNSSGARKKIHSVNHCFCCYCMQIVLYYILMMFCIFVAAAVDDSSLNEQVWAFVRTCFFVEFMW